MYMSNRTQKFIVELLDQLDHAEVRLQEFVQEYHQLEEAKVLEERYQPKANCRRLQSWIQALLALEPALEKFHHTLESNPGELRPK
jgi:hypothetical protein